MDNFIVSARKYRPSTFSTVVGQKSITTTLKNAIQNNHMAHAYLFCGPRGVGKTTCARIFAKTINCQNLNSDTEPCNECESCVSFNSDRSYNIHELDAASNNTVDDIRTLIDKVRIPPQLGKYSVYIIDEVHMLSQSAFNAFLKTLEEPPKHAIFILATTEKHKILPTILSRCQIFNFSRITVEDAANHLAFVAESEKVQAEPEALTVIAQKADGAMRDALSIFDQIVSFSGNVLTYENTIANLNVLDYDYFFKLTDAFITEDISASLTIFDEILDKGFEGQHFLSGLSKHFRDLLVSQNEKTIQLLEVGASIRTHYLEQSKKCSPRFLFQAINTTNESEIQYRSSQNKRLTVELALINLCQLISEKKKVN
jgi:DNA polymerase-3 subunit gamma/tau